MSTFKDLIAISLTKIHINTNHIYIHTHSTVKLHTQRTLAPCRKSTQKPVTANQTPSSTANVNQHHYQQTKH
ncbi:hypothetical protein QVD17_28993 [Tagetes erecta]|uniref:Uncharacterized protein n=1 Tax=Tagetes erecta TaxID=13708 RepID=A0AAD8KBF6_TARER|nr:hypothetical protein QVD17_28993 [Tagetes erecta]